MSSSQPTHATRIAARSARIEDAAEIRRLAAELGYPTEPEEMRARLARLLGDAHHHIVVTDGANGDLLGWAHVEHRASIEGGERAELMGLVVDAKARRGGIGAALLAAAEGWAAAQGLESITVRSNVARELSHPFYAAMGYSRSKTQHVYRKALAPRPARPAARSRAGAGHYTYVWEFLVAPAHQAAFEHRYGPDGVWVALFRRAPGYIETLLLKDDANPLRYLTIDRWESAAAYRAFRAQFDPEYDEIDRACAGLTTRETLLGEFGA